MIDNNIEKTINNDETDNVPHKLVREHSLFYFKVLLDKKVEFPYCGNDFTEHNDNGR